MQEVIGYSARFLRPNPREIKRFANVFRFLVMVATERRLAELEAPDQLSALAKLAVLSTRWPSVVTDLMRPVSWSDERTLFELLEDPPKSAATGQARRGAAERRSLERSLASCGLSEAAAKRLLSDDLRRFMASPPRIGAYADDWL